jgi:hypothetical protein
MPRRCKQSGHREESGESWGEFSADDDEEIEEIRRALIGSSRAAQTARDLTNTLREVPRFARDDKFGMVIAVSEEERSI